MNPLRRSMSILASLSLLSSTTLTAPTSNAQEIVTEADGTRYQVTRRVTERQVPVTVMQDRQQTVYAQQLTTNTINHQQLYCVPSTSYQWSSRLRGRWNPFVTPYWTHQLQPVTSWQTQIANVQVPVSQIAWVPQTKTVQVPVTTYRTAKEETVTKVAMDQPRTMASAPSQPLSRPTATIARRNDTLQPIGGRVMPSDPPREASGWQTPSDSRYR